MLLCLYHATSPLSFCLASAMLPCLCQALLPLSGCLAFVMLLCFPHAAFHLSCSLASVMLNHLFHTALPLSHFLTSVVMPGQCHTVGYRTMATQMQLAMTITRLLEGTVLAISVYYMYNSISVPRGDLWPLSVSHVVYLMRVMEQVVWLLRHVIL